MWEVVDGHKKTANRRGFGRRDLRGEK